MVAAADPLSTMGQDDAEIPRPVAIESDGTEQYRRMSVRERSRLRPQLLERLGWRYMPLWTIEVFTDPSACADRIGGYLGLEKPAVSGRMRASHGFFDDDVQHLAIDEARASENRGFPAAEPAQREVHVRELAGEGSPGHMTRAAQFAGGQRAAHEPGAAHRQELGTGTTDSTGSKEAGGMSADGDIQNNTDGNNTGRNDIDRNSAGTGREEPNGASRPAPGDPTEDGPGEEPAKEKSRRSAEPAVVPGGVLPNKAAEDDPRRWGDQPDNNDHDAWLAEQKPPHWG